MFAMKPVWDRRAKRFAVETVEDADPLLAHDGYVVMDDPVRATGAIVLGKLIPRWDPRKREAVLAALAVPAATTP